MTRRLPVPELLSCLASAPPAGLTLDELAAALMLSSGERAALRLELLELARAGQVVHLGKRYLLQAAEEEPEGEATGLVRVTAGGRGFVDLGEAFEEVLVNPDDLGAALDGDTVVVRSWPGAKRREGQVLRVAARGRTRVTGVLHERPLRLDLDDPRLQLPVTIVDQGGAKDGQAVLGLITGYPARRGDALEVRVGRVLGEPGLLRTEVARSVASGGIEEEFPAEVLREAAAVPASVEGSDLSERLDLRAIPFVTIDPQTARDFDDAVAVEEGPRGTSRVWVAVADVSDYVPEGSALDEEARRRGCSVYLPDRAIPMLPPELSSRICSLVPGEDRLAMVVRFDLDGKGAIVDEECAAALIHSHGRLDYEGVAAVLEGDLRGKRAAYREHLPLLEDLRRVAGLLRTRRLARGSLDLDLPEAEVILDEDDPNRVRGIVETRGDRPLKRAYNLIEELMVAANEVVGRAFERAGVETLWRIHARPEGDALTRLALAVGAYGVKVSPSSIESPLGMNKLLKRLQEHRAARPLSYLVLRTLKQASYSVTNVGHFGLAATTYLHFTSPIRRYPDLHVHRLLKHLLRRGSGHAGRALPLRQTGHAQLSAIARESSAAERRAIEVEREVRGIYAASLMRERIGDEEWGTLISALSYGFFVSLDEPFVEGLVRLERLGDWIELLPEQHRLVGKRSGQIFSLGDRVRVRVIGTSVTRRQIDLELAPGPDTHQPDPQARELVLAAAHAQGGRSAGPRGRGEELRRGRGGPREARGGPRGGRGGGRSGGGRSGGGRSGGPGGRRKKRR